MDDITDLMRYAGIVRNDSQLFSTLSEKIDLRSLETAYLAITVLTAPFSLVAATLLILTIYLKLGAQKLPFIFILSPLASDVLDALQCLCKMPHRYANAPHSEAECVFTASLSGLPTFADALVFLLASLEWLLTSSSQQWVQCAAQKKRLIGKTLVVAVWLASLVVCVALNTFGRKRFLYQSENGPRFCVTEETLATRIHYAYAMPCLLLLTLAAVPSIYVYTKRKNAQRHAQGHEHELVQIAPRRISHLEVAVALRPVEEPRGSDGNGNGNEENVELALRLALFAMTIKFILCAAGPVFMRGLYEFNTAHVSSDWLLLFFHVWYFVYVFWLLALPADCIIVLAISYKCRVWLYELVFRRVALCMARTGRSINARYHLL